MRQSNIELCRIISILFVLLVHSAFAANGYPKELNCSSLWLIILESISIIGVNVFIFISGYFSIRLKPKTIYNIILTCAFYFLLFTGISFFMGIPFELKNLLFVSNSHGFIFSYLCVVMVSPMLNTFAEKTDRKTFAQALIAFFIFQCYFCYLPGIYAKSFHYGYGLVSYSFIYIIARYIKLYGAPKFIGKYSGTIYLVSSLLLIIISCVFVKIGYSVLGRLFAYNNPVIMLSSICFFLSFEKIEIPSNKFINHIAKSTLGVLLFHASAPAKPIVWAFMKKTFTHLADNINFVNIFYWGGYIIAIASIAIVVDQIRIYIIDRVFKNSK